MEFSIRVQRDTPMHKALIMAVQKDGVFVHNGKACKVVDGENGRAGWMNILLREVKL